MDAPDRIDLETLSSVADYRVTKTISTEGGFGDVVLGEKNGEQYAIKLLRLWEVHPDERKSVTARFYREFEAGSIESPHLVKSFECGKHKGNPFHAMEFVPNGSLRDVIDKALIKPDPAVLAAKILLGLKTLHKNGVVHRDLKPENVLIGANHEPKLTDFGISGFMYSRETKTNWMGRVKEMFGTIAYAPPEQFDQFKAFTAMKPTIDIFSFGIMMYEYLTGKYPYGEIESTEDIIMYKNRMKKKEYDPLDKYTEINDKRWIDVIDRCIDPDFKKRFQSVNDLLTKHFSAEVNSSMEDFSSAITTSKKTSGRPVLQIMNGEESKRLYFLDFLNQNNGQLLTIGYLNPNSRNRNIIEIKEENSSYISSFHATLEKHPGGNDKWFLRDGQWREKNGEWSWYNSTNGTLVNSEQLNSDGIYLKPGDIITLGDTTLKFELN